MTTLVVARKEFADARRSRMLWVIVGLIAAMTALAAGVVALIPGAQGGPATAIGAASQFAAILVPIMALIAGYLSIAGERESGSLKVLLGLPTTREEVVVGKFLGRAAVVAVGVAAGFAVAGVVTAVVFGTVPVVAFLGIIALTAALGVSFVGIATGISAVTATRSRAMTLAVGTYLALTLLWDLLPQGVHLLLTGSMPGLTVPGWFLLLDGASPSGAYDVLVQGLLMGGNGALAGRLGGDVPLYLHEGVFVLVLALWTVLPVALGLRRFRVADLS